MAFRLERLADDIPCAKGLLPYCLEAASKGAGARARLQKLRDAIAALAPRYQGLEAVFDRLIVARLFKGGDFRRNAQDYLREYWFDAASPRAHFPGQPVAKIYAEGVLKAIDLALKGQSVVPISAWWILDAPEVRVLTFADLTSAGVTMPGRVTLLIMTPRPQVEAPPAHTPILGEVAEAFVSYAPASLGPDQPAITKRVRDMAPKA